MKRGIAMVPEGRRLFPSLSVEENLLIGATRKAAGPWNLGSVYGLFPILRERRHSPARRCPAASSRWWRSAGR
jgi:branched-chain amino acid transport system ATP-binding protein